MVPWRIRGLFVGAAVGAASLGCTGDEFLHRGAIVNKEIDTSKTPPAPPEMSARVHQLGESLLGQNPFVGVSPVFYVVGRRDLEMYHPGPEGLFITQGLVETCQSDEEVSALLAVELGKMSAEARAAKRMRVAETFRPVGGPGNLTTGNAPDEIQLRAEAIFQEETQKTKKPRGTEDAAAISAELLQSVGIDRKHLDTVRRRLAESPSRTPIADQMTPKSAAPQWSR